MSNVQKCEARFSASRKDLSLSHAIFCKLRTWPMTSFHLLYHVTEIEKKMKSMRFSELFSK